MDSNAMQDQPPRGSRLFHKKSRAGCVKCKQRRVKCDEARPRCSSCSRHSLECVYPRIPSFSSYPQYTSKSDARIDISATSANTQQAAVPQNSTTLSPPTTEYTDAHTSRSPELLSPSSSRTDQPVDDRAEDDVDLPESRERRKWELRLLHNHFAMIKDYADMPEHLVKTRDFDIPNQAFQEGRDAILYGIFASSALHLWTLNPPQKERDELKLLHQTYLSMLLREHRREVSMLSSKNADFLCFSCYRVVTLSIALVQTLPLDPWEPPLEFLQMGRGAFAVFSAAIDLVNGEDGNKFLQFLESPTIAHDTITGDHSALDWLLEHPGGAGSEAAARADTELDDEQTLSVYNAALSYTCSVQGAIDRGETDYSVCRRLGGFAFWIPLDFSRYLAEKRPRALVILAHFMSFWIPYEDMWIFGKAGERQIRGIVKTLPLEWSYKLDSLFAKFKTPKPK